MPRGFWLGEGVYETLLVPTNLPHLPPSWSLHRARFRHGAATLGLPWPGDDTVDRQFTHALQGVASGARLPSHEQSPNAHWWRVRLTLAATGPMSPLSPPERASLWIDIQMARSRIRPPARLQIGPRLRNPAHPFFGAKRIAIGADLHVMRQAQAADWDDVVLLDTQGNVSEASTSNLLFGLRSGGFGTPAPSTAPLPGTTLKLFAAAGHVIEPLVWSPSQFSMATWAVLLNAVSGARPVHCIGSHVFTPPPPAVIATIRRLVDGATA